MSIKVVNIKKKFRHYNVLDNVSVEVGQGEFLALLGPSGSGKTTLLRIIAGLEYPDSGEIYIEGENTESIPLRKRNVGFVFQHYALFRHMSVFENVAFGLRVKPRKERPPEHEIRQRVMNLLKLVHLDGFHRQYPPQLSGGQRQRIALARVLAIEPKVMLLDEPFGALDAKVRHELRRWLRRLHDEMKITTIFVTHDQEEAMEIADRVAIMNQGRVVQIGTPEEIWKLPKNSFVYDFLGNYNEFFAWKDENGNIHLCDDEMLKQAEKEKAIKVAADKMSLTNLLKKLIGFFGFNKQKIPTKEQPAIISSKIPDQKYIKLFSRPFEITLHKTKPAEQESVKAVVTHINPAGPIAKVELERENGQIIQAELAKETFDYHDFAKFEKVWISLKSYRIFE